VKTKGLIAFMVAVILTVGCSNPILEQEAQTGLPHSIAAPLEGQGGIMAPM